MHYTMSHDPYLTRLVLSLYASDRRCERLPKIQTWEPREVVSLTTHAGRVPGASALTVRYEGI